jgi:Cof subfamily protein (haloacid dehalogenase superfamily)
MEKKFLIGLDLDGTVFTEDKKITEKTRKVLAEANDEGAEIVFLSGRPFTGITEEILNFPNTHYLVTSNGALTIDPAEKKLIHGNYLKDLFVYRTIDRIKEIDNVLFTVFMYGIGFMDEEGYEKLVKKYENTHLYSYMKESRKPVPDLARTVIDMREEGYGVENIWLLADEVAVRDQIYEEFSGEDVNLLRTSPKDLEMVSPKADKGTELLYIAEHMGIAKENILAIGDSENDQGMIKAAGCGVAMANATEGTKAVADDITDDNEHDGVAKAIEKFLNERMG